MYEGQPRLLCEASINGIPSLFPDFGGMGEIPAVDTILPQNPDGLLPALGQVLQQEGKLLSDWLDFVPRSDHPTMPIAFFIVFLFRSLSDLEGYPRFF